MQPAITIRGLGKRYRIGARLPVATLRETLSHAAAGLASRVLGRKKSPANDTELWALRDVSFDVQQGQTIGILGRNGAGKSTLLKILSRITDPTEGEAILRGRVASLLEVGSGFHGDLTGRENILLNGAILGMSRREMSRKFDDIVTFAEVERFIDTQVKHYSSGMYMRLAFAVAAHLEPEILVVDEVLAVGDTAFQKKCLGKMKDVAGEGRTVLFVSHNMQAVRTLCTDAVWLDDGRVRYVGESSETIERYLSGGGTQDSSPAIRQQIDALAPDPVFALRGIRILQYEREAVDVGNGSSFEVEISYEVLENVSGLHVYCRLNDAMGVLLFESLHNGTDEGLPVVSKGSYISTMTVPADFLAPGHYSLEIQAGIMGLRALCSKPVVVQISVAHTGRVNQAYPGYGTRGMLAPLLPWHTTTFNSQLPSEDRA